jgi:hypothetical protein
MNALNTNPRWDYMVDVLIGRLHPSGTTTSDDACIYVETFFLQDSIVKSRQTTKSRGQGPSQS